jgi:hypothetical protein
VEWLLGELGVSSLGTRVPVRKGHDFWSYSWIAFKFLQEFPEAVFLAVHVESLLGEAEVSTVESRVPVRKGHNFWSDRWIALKFLHEFPEAVFLVIDVESLLVEAEVSSLETRVPVRKGNKFWSDRWIALKFLQEFPEAVFLEYMWNRYSMRRRSRHWRPEYRFERAITFDATVGSPSNFYRSFRKLFSLEYVITEFWVIPQN